MNPFEAKNKMKMGFSPPKTAAQQEEAMDTEENPFQTRTKMSHSTPPVACEEESSLPPMAQDEKPLQTKPKMANSPPRTRANLNVDNANTKKFTLTPTGSDDEVESVDPLKNLTRVSSESPTRSTTDINDNDSDKTPFQTATDDSSDIAPEPPKPSPK
jgi:hypothetical protein